MYQYQDQKEMRRALNGKMIVMLVGIMLVMTALTSDRKSTRLNSSHPSSSRMPSSA